MKGKKMKQTMVRFMIVLNLIVLFSCGKKEVESRNMEQIYQEEGVPVRIVTLAPRLFETELRYHAVLTGIEESSAYSLVGDQVEKILVKVGDFVQKNQVLLTFPTDNPGAQYSQAKVSFENAKIAYERVKNLFNTGGISRQELDNAKAGYDVAAANWDAAQQSVKVRAPITGRVTKINVRESDNVRRDEELFTISRTNKLKAKVGVAESEINQVKIGMPAYAVWNDSSISGKVVQVDLAMNQQVQAFGAVLEFENRKDCFTCGVTAEVIIKTYKNPKALVIDQKNILNDQDGSFVFVVNSEKAKKRPVQLGKQEGFEVEILEGLQQGDRLIVEGQLLLEDGSKVKIMN